MEQEGTGVWDTDGRRQSRPFLFLVEVPSLGPEVYEEF